jgi:hypothetical protein
MFGGFLTIPMPKRVKGEGETKERKFCKTLIVLMGVRFLIVNRKVKYIPFLTS